MAVVGAGPAGCAAALTLRRYLPELRVVVIATDPRPGPGVGETLSPGVGPLLGYLGLEDAFRRCRHLRSGGTASAWGSPEALERSYLFSGRGLGWQIDRARFDAWLLEQTVAAGAELIVGRGRAGSIAADAVIDAGGRAAPLARHAGGKPRRDDTLVAEVRWYADDPAADLDGDGAIAAGALVESGPDGWWYSASLPDGRAVAMFMTDADLRDAAGWEERLTSAPATEQRLARWTETGQRATRAAHSQLTPAPATNACVAAGDAAAAFDPISSLGIGFALRSGTEAARVAVASLENDPEPGAAYAASVERIYDNYRARLRGIYALERRWPQSPFWCRRAAPVSVAVA